MQTDLKKEGGIVKKQPGPCSWEVFDKGFQDGKRSIKRLLERNKDKRYRSWLSEMFSQEDIEKYFSISDRSIGITTITMEKIQQAFPYWDRWMVASATAYPIFGEGKNRTKLFCLIKGEEEFSTFYSNDTSKKQVLKEMGNYAGFFPPNSVPLTKWTQISTKVYRTFSRKIKQLSGKLETLKFQGASKVPISVRRRASDLRRQFGQLLIVEHRIYIREELRTSCKLFLGQNYPKVIDIISNIIEMSKK
ncbi:MAG: hypothetical protein WC554_06480 [Clostridia bacterium]